MDFSRIRVGFLNLFISFLVVGSLPGLDRDVLIKSSVLHLPAILAGLNPSGYLSFALAVPALENIISVIFAVILNVSGAFFPRLTGNGQLVKTGRDVSIREKAPVTPTMDDAAAGIFLTGGFFVPA